jgi:hypothetical protein
MTDWTPEEDEAFNEVEKHSNLGKQILRDMEGQPYHFEPVFVSVSQRNQVLEEAAVLCFEMWEKWMNADPNERHNMPRDAEDCAAAIRGLKK